MERFGRVGVSGQGGDSYANGAHAVLVTHMKWEDIEVQAKHKQAERGGFDRRIFLEHVDQAP